MQPSGPESILGRRLGDVFFRERYKDVFASVLPDGEHPTRFFVLSREQAVIVECVATSETTVDRQTKTAPELDQLILTRLSGEMACPPDLQIRCSEWKANGMPFPEYIDKDKHPECLARIVLIAEDIRGVYDLAD